MIPRTEVCQRVNPTQVMMNQSSSLEDAGFLHSKTVSLQSRMKLPFKVSCMECIDNKVIVGSEQGGLYAYTVSNGTFKMLFSNISAHKGSQVSQLHAQANIPQTIFSCGFYERRVVSWNIAVQFMKNTESKVFKTFIYQLTSAQNKYILISTLKKIYALDAMTLVPMLKFTIQNYKSLDYLISSLGYMISLDNASYLIAGTDNYKKSNFFLALWQVSSTGNDDHNSEQQFVKKTRKLSNIDDLDNFDLDAECADIETEIIEAVVPKISNPQLLEYSHSSRVFDIKVIPAHDRFVTLSYTELNIWAINTNNNCNNNNFKCQFSSSSLCGIQLVYSLRFSGEVNPQMNLRLSTVEADQPFVLLFLDSLMLLIDPSNPSFISQIPVTTTRSAQNKNNNIPQPASLSLLPCPATGSNEYSTHILNHQNLEGNNYAHANHFILRQNSTTHDISPPSQALIFIRQLTSRKPNPSCIASKPAKTMISREFMDIVPTLIYPIEEEHSEMEEELSKPHMDTKSLYYPYSTKPQSLHVAPSTAHILPSAASVTILQNQLKKLEQSKTGKSLANIPAVCFSRKSNSSGQLRSNSKSIKKQLKRVVKFSNRRKKKANQQNVNISKDLFLQQQQQQQYYQSQQQNHQQLSQFQPRRFNQSSLSPPRTKISKYTQGAYQQQSSQQSNLSAARKLSLSPRQVAITAVQNKQQQQQQQSQQNTCKIQNNYNNNCQFKQQTQNQLGYSHHLHAKPAQESPRLQPISGYNTNICSTNQQQQTVSKMMAMKSELPAIQLVALDSQLALGYWKFS